MITAKDIIASNDVKRNIIDSINEFSRDQKLEAQIQGLLFSELLKKQLPRLLLECEVKNNADKHTADILIGETLSGEPLLVELKYQFEFDIKQMLRFYNRNTNKKLAKSIEKDIEKSSIFIMFILERSWRYLEDWCMYQEKGLCFKRNTKTPVDTFKQYSNELEKKYSKYKNVEFIESYAESNSLWKLHLICATSQ